MEISTLTPGRAFSRLFGDQTRETIACRRALLCGAKCEIRAFIDHQKTRRTFVCRLHLLKQLQYVHHHPSCHLKPQLFPNFAPHMAYRMEPTLRHDISICMQWQTCRFPKSTQLAAWSLPRPQLRHEWTRTNSSWISLSRFPSRRTPRLPTAFMTTGQSMVCDCPSPRLSVPDKCFQALRSFPTRLCTCTYGICMQELHV